MSSTNDSAVLVDDNAQAHAGRRFQGKVALVTGGRAGIGRAIAARLQAEGAWVFTAQRGADGEFDAVQADFTDPASPARVME